MMTVQGALRAGVGLATCCVPESFMETWLRVVRKLVDSYSGNPNWWACFGRAWANSFMFGSGK